jgi:hypothetical protein
VGLKEEAAHMHGELLLANCLHVLPTQAAMLHNLVQNRV